MKNNRMKILNFVISKLSVTDADAITIPAIVKAVNINVAQFHESYPDYETLLFDVLSVISMYYLREMFSGIPAISKKSSPKNKQLFFEILLMRLQAFFTSELGKAFISIYQQFEFDARFERLLTAIKTEWYEMLHIALSRAGMSTKTSDAFYCCFNTAYQAHRENAGYTTCTVH